MARKKRYLYGKFYEGDVGFPSNPGRKDLVLYLDNSDVDRPISSAEGFFETSVSIDKDEILGNRHISYKDIESFEEKYEGKFISFDRVNLPRSVQIDEEPKKNRVGRLVSKIKEKQNIRKSK